MPRQEDVEQDCDRCGKEIDGFRVMYTREELEVDGDAEIPERWEDRDEFPIGTAGYYRTSSGEWAKYTDDGEDIICDFCMETDERYRQAYPQGEGS